jgi:tripartite ATP-independent transporter DctP family solute receptor
METTPAHSHLSKAKMSLWLVALLFWACNPGQQAKVLKLSHTHDVTHPVHEAVTYLGEQLAKKSGGKLTLKVFTSAQLGQEREAIELLQIGSLAMTKVSSSVMENFVPSYRALSFPYVFRDKAHQVQVLDGEIGRQVLDESEKYLLHGLCFYDAGSRSFYMKKKPINTPADLAGQKVRVMKSNTAIQMVESLGGAPAPISYGELYTALQQGVVDGAENNSPSFLSSRHYEICKFYSIDEHTSVPDVLLISSVIWQTLDAQEKKWLEEAVAESAAFQRKRWAEAEQQALEAVQKAGVVVNYPDKKAFAAQVADMYEKTKAESPELYRLIRQIQAQ